MLQKTADIPPFSTKKIFSFNDATRKDKEIEAAVDTASKNYEQTYGFNPEFQRVEPTGTQNEAFGKEVSSFLSWFQMVQGAKVVWVEYDREIHQAFVDPARVIKPPDQPEQKTPQKKGRPPLFPVTPPKQTLSRAEQDAQFIRNSRLARLHEKGTNEYSLEAFASQD